MSKLPKVSIIVVNWNNKKDTAECLNSLLQVDYPNFQVLLVDNGSTDGSAAFFREHYPGLKMIENKANLFFAEGNNVVLRQLMESDTDYFFLVNNDTIVDKNILRELVKISESSPDIGIVGPKIYYYQPNNVIWHAGGRLNYWRCDFGSIGIRQEDRGQFDQVRDVDYVAGCGLLIKKEVVCQIGFLDSSYVMYMDDPDWCVRAKKKGYRIVYVPAAKMWHKISASTGGGLTPFKAYYKGKNTIKFFWKYAKWYHWLTIPLFAGVQLAAGLGRELKKGNIRILKPMLKGVIDYFKEKWNVIS